MLHERKDVFFIFGGKYRELLFLGLASILVLLFLLPNSKIKPIHQYKLNPKYKIVISLAVAILFYLGRKTFYDLLNPFFPDPFVIFPFDVFRLYNTLFMFFLILYPGMKIIDLLIIKNQNEVKVSTDYLP